MQQAARIVERFRDGKCSRRDVEGRLNELWLDNVISNSQYDRLMIQVDVIASQSCEAT